MQDLDPKLADYVISRAIERRVEPGAYVHARGSPPEFWVGVVEGLLFMSRDSERGFATAVASVHAGEWIGEASLLFLKERQFDLIAMRSSRLILVPRIVFKRLFETSIPFNNYLVLKLARRMGRLAKLLSADRTLTPGKRLAFCLVSVLNADVASKGQRIGITQIEVSQLMGLSRQHANKAFHELQKAGLISIERGAVKIVDADGLQRLIS
jgi:CRP-like cAMP-binding protein